MKVLTIFFSRADENYFSGAMRYIKVGNTETVVNIIKSYIDTDVFKIEMSKPYSANYSSCIQEAKDDLKQNKKPELIEYLDSLDNYDTVILAYPNYWGTIPMPVVSLIERLDWNGKVVLPLCTNEGSGMGSSERDIKKLCKGAVVKSGLSVTGSNAANSGNQVKKWLSNNKIL